MPARPQPSGCCRCRYRATFRPPILPGIVTLTQSGVDAPRKASRPHREKLFAALADVELLYAMHGTKRFVLNDVTCTASDVPFLDHVLFSMTSASKFYGCVDEGTGQGALGIKASVFPFPETLIQHGSSTFRPPARRLFLSVISKALLPNPVLDSAIAHVSTPDSHKLAAVYLQP